MELLTAILAGDRTLELRIFVDQEITDDLEERLTARLCRLMDNKQTEWAQ